MSNLLTACCCQGECDESCPSDGEEGNCPLNSFASAYSIQLGVGWDGNGTVSFGDNGLTYTKMNSGGTGGFCWTGGGEIGSTWNYKCIWWKPPATGGFPSTPVPGNYAAAHSCPGPPPAPYSDSYSQLDTDLSAVGTGPGGIFTRQGLLLVHEFDCSTKFPYSIYYYIYSTYRVVRYVPQCFIGPQNAIVCYAIAYSTPSTQCLLEPDDTLQWHASAPTSGSLAYQSKIIRSVTNGTTATGHLSFRYYCPSCNNPGGSPHSNINFTLAVT